MNLVRWKFIFKNHIIHIVNLWEVGNASRFVRLLVFTVFRSSVFLRPRVFVCTKLLAPIFMHATFTGKFRFYQLLRFEVLTKLPQWINTRLTHSYETMNQRYRPLIILIEIFIKLSINFRERAEKTILLKLD